MRIAAPAPDTGIGAPPRVEPADRGDRGHAGGVAPELAGFVGRIQCGLIGSRTVAVAFVPDTTFVVLAAVAARAFGSPAVVALLDRADGRTPRDAAFAADLAGAAGIPLLEGPAGPLDEADLSVLGVDTLARPEIDPAPAARRPRLAAASGHRVLHPLRDAGLSRAHVDALASALGLPSCLRRRDAGS